MTYIPNLRAKIRNTFDTFSFVFTNLARITTFFEDLIKQ